MKNVNMSSFLIDPNKGIGPQIKLAREKKNIKVADACKKFESLTGSKMSRVTWYASESKDSLHFDKVVAMLTAIGIENIFIDDYTGNG